MKRKTHLMIENCDIKEILKQLRNRPLNERVSMYDLQNASKDKRDRWAETQTNELEKLYGEILKARKDIPDAQFDAWDLETFKIIEDIIAERRANAVRKDIARMMELAGQHWGVDKKTWEQRQQAKKKLGK